MRIIKAIEESLKTGRPVTLPPGKARAQRPSRAQVMKLRAVKQGEMVNAAPPEGEES